MPSAFQFRLGGCKGVLAIDSKLEGQSIHIRPSMKKFESGHLNSVEIISYTKPSKYKAMFIMLSYLLYLLKEMM